MSDGKNKRPLDIPFVKWTWKCPLVFHVYIGSNGQVEFPSDICFFSWSITMYLNDVMTSPCRYCAIEIAKRKCPLDPMDPMDLEMSIGILFVHWIQWTSGISIEHLLFQLVFTMYLNDVMTSPWTSCRYCAIEIAKRKCPLDTMDPMDLEMSIGILFVHWIQWTSGISIGHLLFQLVNYHVLG